MVKLKLAQLVDINGNLASSHESPGKFFVYYYAAMIICVLLFERSAFLLYVVVKGGTKNLPSTFNAIVIIQ